MSESLRQTRQRAEWARAQAINGIEAHQAEVDHLDIMIASMTLLIDGDVTPPVEPDPPVDPPADPPVEPPASDIHFSSRWQATGNPDADMLADVWERVTGRNVGPAVEILPADAGLMGRGDIFRLHNSGENSRQVQLDQMVPPSTTHWGRVYVRSNNLTSRHNHSIQIGGGSGYPIEFAIGLRGTSAGSVPNVTASGDDADGRYPGVRWWASGVDNPNGEDTLVPDRLYLLEWQIEYHDPSNPRRYRVRAWISEVDSDGVVTLADKWTASDFFESDQPGTGRNLADQLFSLSTDQRTMGTPEKARRYSFGNEGPRGAPSDPGYTDFADFAISVTGRIGAA